MALGGQLSLGLEQVALSVGDRFIVTGVNREAVRTLEDWPRGRTGALALIGPSGCGKTQLAAAWARRTGASLISADQLAAGEGWPDGPMLLDDADQASHGEAFFHLLNAAERPGASLLMTGRTRPTIWPVEVQDLRSRLNATPIIELGGPDEEILKAMLHKYFQQHNIRAPEDLIGYLALRIERSAAAAAAIVRALDEASLPDQRGVSRVLARQLLKDEAPESETEPPL